MNSKADIRDSRQRHLLALLQDGIPLTAQPFRTLAEQTGMGEAEVIDNIRNWLDAGIFKRWGAVINHRAVGYRSNAMVVWDIPDDQVDTIAQRLAQEPRITLCYRRRRQLPVWPYNLFTMIHGTSDDDVRHTLDSIRQRHQLDLPCEMLISRRCFRQRGARYIPRPETTHVQG